MQNQIQTFDLLNKLPSLILAALPIVIILLSYFYVRNIFRKIDDLEKDIFAVKDGIDNLEATLAKKGNGYVSQSQLDRWVEKERKPMKAELENLKMKRQFLLDKIPLLGLLKK